MKNSQYSVFSLLDALGALICIAWFVFPVAAGPVSDGGNLNLYVPYSMPVLFLQQEGLTFFTLSLFLIYLVPLFSLFRILSFFMPSRFGRFAQPEYFLVAVIRFLMTVIMVFPWLVPMLRYADSADYFKHIPLAPYNFAGISVAGNIASVVILLKLLNKRDQFVREYKEYKRSLEKNTFLDFIFRIRTKLFFFFIGLITIIIGTLSLLLLQSYKNTIIKAVSDGARSQVEQASSIYRVNLGDSIAMFEYLNRQLELNKKAEFPNEYISIYTDLKTVQYIAETMELRAAFRLEYSTLSPNQQFPSLPALDARGASEYIKKFLQTRGIVSSYEPETDSRLFIGPILKPETVKIGENRVRQERLLGFTIMAFRESVIMKPFYKTRVLVITLTLLFLYLAIVMVYLIGNYIVNPLLFLRMNVRKISDNLQSMIRGTVRVSSNALVYSDYVRSRDEIKSLSHEIGNMVTVLKGVIPYISASTLKQAEKGTASSTNRELAFLFTDIRGFTSLCEGLEPDQVVSILNRYLDLETEIILQNDGDVDKFVGDEMMAFFDGPHKELHACKAAMQIRHAMMQERELREKEGKQVVSIGIGINSGPVVFGSVGARDRMDFTSIGDTVNLAARLEGANKQYNSKSIITEAVYLKVQDAFICRELDFIAVKGKTEPVRIFEILQEKDKAQAKLLQIKDLFEKGLAAYRRQNWKTAAAAFAKNVELYKDGPSEVFLRRVIYFDKNPPGKDWDGVFRATEK
ncbi:adenylate/guanylate cyclase domain-containing protein [Gracilinema caldarium]|uniref:adenylate/guanylate cyclase domain-containing protein n=1 Tax=Gracilinema caldarium TaxID=215591 RepID=UPI0026EA77BB|nr:adenylate/guanylate cyclase domain-containing protein [Gracilinema caldarium]